MANNNPPSGYTTSSSGQYVPISTTGSGGLNDPGNGGINPQGNAYANNSINNANTQYGAITQSLRDANTASNARIDSQTAGQTQEARDFEFKSQNFARARLGKIGGFEGTYGIGLQNSIAQRTEKNIQAIKRAGEEAKASGDMELGGRLAELGLQQMTLIAQLNAQAFEESKFKQEFEYGQGRDTIGDEQYDRTFGEGVRQFDLGLAEDQRQFGITQANRGGTLGTDETAGLPKGFTGAAENARYDLLTGGNWEFIIADMEQQFPTATREQIETALRGTGATTRMDQLQSSEFQSLMPQEVSVPPRGLADPENIPRELDINTEEYRKDTEIRQQIQQWWNDGYGEDQISELIRGQYGREPSDFGYPGYN